jgi:hypothetical protein
MATQTHIPLDERHHGGPVLDRVHAIHRHQRFWQLSPETKRTTIGIEIHAQSKGFVSTKQFNAVRDIWRVLENLDV